MIRAREQVLEQRLEEFISLHTVFGLSRPESRERLVKNAAESLARLRGLRIRRFAGSLNPHDKRFHPFLAIVRKFKTGQCDEAIWLAFLCAHFGWEGKSPRNRDTVRLFYGKFGRGFWDWQTVRQNADAIREWILANATGVKRLRFSNHRKYETNNPRSRVGTAAVINSFVDWVHRHGKGSPYAALSSFLDENRSAEATFDALYRDLNVVRFGRTARFDFLCLLSNLGILRIRPGHCYLRGATGPRMGAILLVTGKRKGRLTAHAEQTIHALQECLGVPAECLEDALCNWQKSKEKGFLSATCY